MLGYNLTVKILTSALLVNISFIHTKKEELAVEDAETTQTIRQSNKNILPMSAPIHID